MLTRNPPQSCKAPTAKRLRLSGCLVLALACITAGCGVKEALNQEKMLKPLAARRATKEELVRLLGTNYIDYSRASADWFFLTNYLANVPKDRLADVGTRAAKSATVFLYSSPYVRTWVFLDGEGKVVDFVIDAQ